MDLLDLPSASCRNGRLFNLYSDLALPHDLEQDVPAREQPDEHAGDDRLLADEHLGDRNSEPSSARPSG